MHQRGIDVDDQRVCWRGQLTWIPWPGRISDFGAQVAGHGGEPVSESFWLVLDVAHEPADGGVRCYRAEELWCGA